MIGSSRSYAIGRAHFLIAGGARTLAMVCVVYVFLYAMGWAMIYYAGDPGSRGRSTDMAWGATTLTTAFEALVLIFFASLQVAGAIGRDISSRMIESHRLMPVPAWRAVTGYIFGGGSHAIAFGALNGALAFVASRVAGMPLDRFIFNQFLLFLFALLVWTLVALISLAARRAYFLIFALFVAAAAVPAYLLLPGFALLVGPVIRPTIFIVPSYSGSLPAAHLGPAGFAASIAGQLAFIAILFVGACRRYRGTFATTFTSVQAFLLLGAWCAISAAGLACWNDFCIADNTRAPGERFAYIQVLGSIVVGLLLAIILIHALAAANRRRAIWAGLAIPLLLAGIAAITMIPLGLHGTEQAVAGNFAITALVVAAHVAAVLLAFRVFRRLRANSLSLVLGVGILCLWGVPLILELIRFRMESSGQEDLSVGVLSTLSPVGLLFGIWGAEDPVTPMVYGLTLQWGVVVVLGAWLFLQRRRAPLAVPAGSGLAAASPGIMLSAAAPSGASPSRESLPGAR